MLTVLLLVSSFLHPEMNESLTAHAECLNSVITDWLVLFWGSSCCTVVKICNFLTGPENM